LNAATTSNLLLMRRRIFSTAHSRFPAQIQHAWFVRWPSLEDQLGKKS
jgi:hypothetical protein